MSYKILNADCLEWLGDARHVRSQSSRTPECEAAIIDHPTIKPQHFLRIIVRAMLPLGQGVVLDPFAGSGSTIAAADAVGYDAIGVELDEHYFMAAQRAVPLLSHLYPGFTGDTLDSIDTVVSTRSRPRKAATSGPQQSLL